MPDGQEQVRADYLTRFSATRQPEKTGRPRESRDRLTSAFLMELANDFAENGASAIKNVRENEPAQYLRVVASLVPKEIEVKRPMGDIDDEKLQNAIALLEAMKKLGEPKAIDAEVVEVK